MHKRILVVFLFILSMVLSGCTSDLVRAPVYNGTPITIGVVGEFPVVREEHVDFKKVSFSQLKDFDSLADYDAVFIMKNNLSEASEPIYTETYRSAGVPFFFIESTKSYLPFISEERTYDEFPDLNTDVYASGYFQNEEQHQNWSYGLQDDQVSRSHIEDVYTRIFETVEQIKNR